MEQQGGKTIHNLELSKTERDIRIIRFAEDAVKLYFASYGRTRDLLLPINHIHVLIEGGTSQYTEGRLFGGAHSSTLSSIIVDRVSSDVDFALRTFHEICHLKSYRALQITTGSDDRKPTLDEFRTGFALISRDGKNTYFSDFEEAVTALLEREFYEKMIKTSELFSHEVGRIQQEGREVHFSRSTEVEELNALIDDLWENNKSGEMYNEKIDILRIFIEAKVNGNLFPVGRLIEATYGKGSFRRLCDDTAQDKEITL